MLEDDIHKVLKHNNLQLPLEVEYIITKNYREKKIKGNFYTVYEIIKIYNMPNFSRWICPFFSPIMPKKNKFDDYNRAMGII